LRVSKRVFGSKPRARSLKITFSFVFKALVYPGELGWGRARAKNRQNEKFTITKIAAGTLLRG
jgi:hypothetical protein